MLPQVFSINGKKSSIHTIQPFNNGFDKSFDKKLEIILNNEKTYPKIDPKTLPENSQNLFRDEFSSIANQYLSESQKRKTNPEANKLNFSIGIFNTFYKLILNVYPQAKDTSLGGLHELINRTVKTLNRIDGKTTRASRKDVEDLIAYTQNSKYPFVRLCGEELLKRWEKQKNFS
jgi:hypothetical protein